jgi:hypothetical protein
MAEMIIIGVSGAGAETLATIPLAAEPLTAPGNHGAGAKYVGAKVSVVGSIYTGEVVGWYGGDRYTVKVDYTAGAVPALAGPQQVAAYHYSKLALLAPAAV